MSDELVARVAELTAENARLKAELVEATLQQLDALYPEVGCIPEENQA